MKFAFVAKHRSIWPVAWLCKALDVSTSAFHDWLNRQPSNRTLENEAVLCLIRQSFHDSDRTYGASSSPRSHKISATKSFVSTLSPTLT